MQSLKQKPLNTHVILVRSILERICLEVLKDGSSKDQKFSCEEGRWMDLARDCVLWWHLMSCNTELFHSETREVLHIIITLSGIHVILYLM